MTRYALKRVADDSVVRYANFDEAPPVLAEAKGLVWVESPIVVVEPDPQSLIPQTVSMRQARLALHAAGMLAGINAAITQIGGAAQIEWEYATEVRRDNQLIEMVRQANSMTVEQIDQLFIAASQIE